MSTSSSPLADAAGSQQPPAPVQASQTQMPQYSNADEQQTSQDLQGPQQQPGSRLAAVLNAVSKVVSTGMAGVPDKGRPSFVSGLGEGARSEQAAQAQQQDIKFKTFDDQIRAAQLTHQDLELQGHLQEQQDAHQAAQDAQHDWDDAHGVEYEEIPNSGNSATNYLQAQTAANGAASIPPGTHLSADGKTIFIPKQSDVNQAAQLQKYNAFREAYNLPALPKGAQFVPSKNADMLQNVMEGHSLSGAPYDHNSLPTAIADLQQTRDTLAAKGSTDPDVLKQVDANISSMQAKLKFLDDHAASVAQSAAQAKAQGTADVQNNPTNQKAAAQGAGMKAGAEAAATAPFKQNNQPNQGQADPFGVSSSLSGKEYNSRYNSFSKSYVQPLTKTDQTASQFQSILNDVNSGKDLTGAQSVVSLFDAIGISATPMKGQGFRLNKDVMEEHVQARGVDQSVAQKLGQLKSGEIITPQQIKDYASIATQARQSQYFSAIDEARRQGLPVDFLPKGGGQQLDTSTASMYLRAAGGDKQKAMTAAQQAGWRF